MAGEGGGHRAGKEERRGQERSAAAREARTQLERGARAITMRSRLPVFFPNLFMRLMPLKDSAKARVVKGEVPQELVFRVPPSATKVEVKRYLEAIYGLDVKKVFTANYMGKKKMSRSKRMVSFRRLPDYKKAIVELNTGESDATKRA